MSLDDAIRKAEAARRALTRSSGAKHRLHDFEIQEVSMVHAPAVPAARFAVVKRDDHLVVEDAHGEHVIPQDVAAGLKHLGGRL